MSTHDPSDAEPTGPLSVDPDAFPEESSDDTPSWVVEDEKEEEHPSYPDGPFFVDPNDFPDDPPQADGAEWVTEGAPEVSVPHDPVSSESAVPEPVEAPPTQPVEARPQAPTSGGEALYIEEEPPSRVDDSDMESEYISIGQPESKTETQTETTDSRPLRLATWAFMGIGALCGVVVLFALALQFAAGGGDTRTATAEVPAPSSADIRGIPVRNSLQAPPQPADPLKERLRELEAEEEVQDQGEEAPDTDDADPPEPLAPSSAARVPSGDPIRD